MFQKFFSHFKLFLKYAVVGVLATVLDVAALFVFVDYYAFAVIIASAFSFLIANIASFILNKVWTFQVESKNYRKLYIKFLTVSLVGLALTVALMYLFSSLLGIWYVLAKLLTSAVVVVWNFLANKLWTFQSKHFQLNILDKFLFEYSIIIPAYNEQNRIASTLNSIQDWIAESKVNAEIIIVSDGSTDQTCQVVNQYLSQTVKLIQYTQNKGKGYAIKQGIQLSLGEYILFTDADNSTPITELQNLMHQLKNTNSDIAIGSRYLKSSNVKIKQSSSRILIGRIGNFIIRLFLIDGILDTQCGFKLFKHRVAKEIFNLQKVKRFGFDMEALVIATNLGYKITEVPVSWFNSTDSRVRPIKDALRTLKELFYIKLNLWAGRYNPEELNQSV